MIMTWLDGVGSGGMYEVSGHVLLQRPIIGRPSDKTRKV